MATDWNAWNALMAGQQEDPMMSMPGQQPPMSMPPQRGPASMKFRPAPSVTQPDFTESAEMPQRTPSAMAVSGRTPLSLDALRKMIAQQTGNADTMAGYAQRYKELMATKGGDLSPLLRMVDSAFGSDTAKGYESPQAAEGDKLAKQMAMQKMVNDAYTPIASELLKQYNSDNSAESKLNRALAGRIGAADKLSQSYGDRLFFMRGVAPEERKPLLTLDRVRKAAKLIGNIETDQAGKIDKNELAELGAALATTITGSNVLTDHQMNAFVPKSIQMDVAGIIQWLKGAPQGVEQKEWLKRFKKTLRAEQSGAVDSIHGWQDAQKEYFASRGLDEEQLERGHRAARKWIGAKLIDSKTGQNPLDDNETVRLQDPATGKWYNLPLDEVEAFKKDKGIK